MKNLLKAMAVSLVLLFTAPGFGQGVHITLTPPMLQMEVIPEPPFASAVWQQGYYSYDPVTESYTYISGKWVMPPFEGATWIAPYYRFHNGEYFFIPGRWKARTMEREREHEKEHD